ncbi:MAG: GNAT family N-acetyltransferase [Candidatus Eremiobacteraeota bacterium]|nr:GNAT family N-acetyltransferase [Candidatus Eremiobacteraeota bacterium]
MPPSVCFPFWARRQLAETDVVPALALDLAYFAQRRWNDEQSSALWQYLAQSAPNGAWVAKDAGDSIGIALPHALEEEWFLADLFVEPSFRGQGIGMRLLSEAARNAEDVARSGLAPMDAVDALAFLVHRGLPLHAPVFVLRGDIPHENELLRMASGDYRFATQAIDLQVHRGALNALDREIRGAARPLDHHYFASNAHGVAFLLHGEFVAYTYVWPNGRIGPMCASSAAYLRQLFAFALVALRQVYDARWCTALVPGSNIRVMRTGVRAGLRIDAASIFASDGIAFDLSRYIGFHPLLF